MPLRLRLIAVVSLVAVVSCGPGTSPLGPDPKCGNISTGKSELQVTDFGSNPGGLKMHTYVPDNMPARAPLVVALHGCTQSAAAYAGAGWNQLADKWKFYVVYPETTAFGSCFKWFDSGHTRRDSGEALSIMQMVEWMKEHHGIDSRRVFVTGLSAGGAMTSVMLAAYPEVFSAGAIMAGIPYRCADSQINAGACMTGRDLTPEAWGDLVRQVNPGFAGPYPRVSLWHGSADYVVGFPNLRELVDQWTDLHGASTTPNSTEQIGAAEYAKFQNAAGEVAVERWTIQGMGHGTPVDPGFAPAGGCGTAGAFILDVGLCSTYHAGLFFGLDSAGGTGPGTPADGGTGPGATDAGHPNECP